MRKNQKQDQCTVYERHGQLVLAINSERMIPENAPVRLLSAQLEEKARGIEFVRGKGKRKNRAQRDREENHTLLERWEWYNEMRSA